MTDKIKLHADAFPYSSVVGGGLSLSRGEDGPIAFLIHATGTTQGITRQETEEIAGRLVELINTHGLEVTPRPEKPTK